MSWINQAVKIDFSVPTSLQELIDELERLDQAEDYAYFNYAEALDDAGKELCRQGRISRDQWNRLTSRY